MFGYTVIKKEDLRFIEYARDFWIKQAVSQQEKKYGFRNKAQ